MNKLRFSMSLGMVACIFYFVHVFLGQLLRSDYNPITTDISSLTAVGAPNVGLLGTLTFIYGILMIAFMIIMLVFSYKNYSKITSWGYFTFLVMSLVSFVGYTLFPLSPDKFALNFQNIMHMVVTVVVMLSTIIAIFLLGIGYKRDKLFFLSKISLLVVILIIVFGVFNAIFVALGFDIFGLTQRLVIFTLHFFIFFLSFIYTFKSTKYSIYTY